MKRNVITIDFDELFHWAEKYGVSWNQANDLFFRSGVLNYKSYDSWTCGEGIENCDSLYESGRESWDLTREEIDALTDDEKAPVLIDIFLHELGVKDVLFLND